MSLSLPWFRGQAPLAVADVPLIDRATPTAVAEYLAAHPGTGELFHAADWGGYFGWRLGPERTLFIDDRMELHPPKVWRDYLALSRSDPGWQPLLDSYGVGRLALDPRSQAALIAVVTASPEWIAVYDDGRAVVFERRRSEADRSAGARLATGTDTCQEHRSAPPSP